MKLRKWDVQMFLPAQWRGAYKVMFAFREKYEPELDYLERILSPGKFFVDVGACVGIYTLVASKLVGDSGGVLAIEPTSQSFAALRRNVELNRLANVSAVRVALGDTEGMAHLYHHPSVGRGSLGRSALPTQQVEEVPISTLDKVLEQTLLKAVDVIKMDVEGAEELVLRGARATLNSSRPVVIFEINRQAASCLSLSGDGAWELLKGLGYQFYQLHDLGNLSRLQSPPPGQNVIAIHPRGPA